MPRVNRKPDPSLLQQVVRRTTDQSRKDIRDWKYATYQAQLAQNPKFNRIQDIYREVADDALLSSQMNNRIEQSVAASFELVDKKGTVDEAATALLHTAGIAKIIRGIVESRFYGYSLDELHMENGELCVDDLPRRNFDPVFGRFYPDASGVNYIEYRTIKEYGMTVLEFNEGNIGLLNKAVPHVLFKKFAQSCWSELCEIYGIPPRYIKTNTNDPEMLERAENMMREVGSAAAFVIDTTEEFAFANASSTNGDVYKNLISLCNNEISLLISGAIIGQDTANGNYSKEESSIKMLDRLIDADRAYVVHQMNAVVLPALRKLGYLPQSETVFRYKEIEDTDKLWQMVLQALPYKDVDSEWMEEKFGIPVQDKQQLGLSATPDFFA